MIPAFFIWDLVRRSSKSEAGSLQTPIRHQTVGAPCPKIARPEPGIQNKKASFLVVNPGLDSGPV
jgi:hypothetical protein